MGEISLRGLCPQLLGKVFDNVLQISEGHKEEKEASGKDREDKSLCTWAV